MRLLCTGKGDREGTEQKANKRVKLRLPALVGTALFRSGGMQNAEDRTTMEIEAEAQRLAWMPWCRNADHGYRTS